MASKIDGLDFSQYKKAMVEREGYSPEVAEESWNDLVILLKAMEAEPSRSFAMTVSADRALHGLLLDTVGYFRFSTTVFGADKFLVHDPYAYATPEFDEGWDNTREAFAKVGMTLPATYRDQISETAAGEKAEICLVSARDKAEICLVSAREKAEICLVSARDKAEICLVSVREQAAICLLSAKETKELVPA